MKIIACVDKNWGIGYKGNLLYRFPEDMDLFKKITIESGIVIMGRKTFNSLNCPIGLKHRENWVLSNDVKNSETILSRAKEINPKSDLLIGNFSNFKNIFNFINKFYKKTNELDRICVIGGEEIYNMFLPYCDTAYITYVNEANKNVDSYFPENLDCSTDWILESSYRGKNCLRVGTYYKFNVYKNTNVLDLDEEV